VNAPITEGKALIWGKWQPEDANRIAKGIMKRKQQDQFQ
jgi:hypothetical protein